MADSLVDQIFEQARAGSAQGQGIPGFAQGVQLGLEQQRINLANRQFVQELAKQRVQSVLDQQTAEMNALKLNEMKDTRSATINNESAFQSLNGQVASFMTGENPAGAEAAVWSTLAKNPGMWRHPGIQPLLQDIRVGAEARMKLQELKNLNKASNFVPEVTTVTNPVNGEVIPILRTGPNTSKELQPTNEAKSPFGKLLADRNDAFNRGDSEAVQAFDTKIALDSQKSGFSVTTNPDGTVTVTQGPLTQANQTKVQQQLMASLQTIDTANRVLPLIDNETMGLEAFAKSWINDKILAQRFPKLASEKRADAVALVAQLRASAVKDLRSDSNISEPERNQILQAVPEVNAPLNSAVNAQRLVIGLRKMAAIHSVVASFNLKKPLPRAAAMLLDADELVRLKKSGVLTHEQAMDVMRARAVPQE